jgi:excisionase family DNA binding protein
MIKNDYMEKRMVTMKEVPIWEKSNLTLEEAAAYSGIGINKLRKMTDDESCEFVLWIGTKRLIKRRKLDEYIERMYSV